MGSIWVLVDGQAGSCMGRCMGGDSKSRPLKTGLPLVFVGLFINYVMETGEGGRGSALVFQHAGKGMQNGHFSATEGGGGKIWTKFALIKI